MLKLLNRMILAWRQMQPKPIPAYAPVQSGRFRPRWK